TWQLVINTATTIVTFLMVFLIQNTQNRDTEAIQLKLDELIRSTRGAHNALLDLEVLEEDTLDAFRAKYAALASAARTQLDRGLGEDARGTRCRSACHRQRRIRVLHRPARRRRCDQSRGNAGERARDRRSDLAARLGRPRERIRR